MEQKIIIDELTNTSVSIMTRDFITVEGKDYFVGNPHRKAYVNSQEGRESISKELPEPYLSAVMAMWGDKPLVVYEDME